MTDTRLTISLGAATALALLLPALFLDAVNDATGARITLAGYGVLVVAIVSCLFLGLLAMAAVEAAVWTRDQRALRPHRLNWFEFDDQLILRRYERPVEYRGFRRPLVGQPELDWWLDMSEVAYATWFVTPIAINTDDDLIQFWDRDPQLELQVLGPVPTDADAQMLGIVSIRDLAASPEMHRALVDHLDRMTLAGLFDSNVDLMTAEPIKAKLPPLADGVRFEGDAIVPDIGGVDEAETQGGL